MVASGMAAAQRSAMPHPRCARFSEDCRRDTGSKHMTNSRALTSPPTNACERRPVMDDRINPTADFDPNGRRNRDLRNSEDAWPSAAACSWLNPARMTSRVASFALRNFAHWPTVDCNELPTAIMPDGYLRPIDQCILLSAGSSYAIGHPRLGALGRGGVRDEGVHQLLPPRWSSTPAAVPAPR